MARVSTCARLRTQRPSTRPTSDPKVLSEAETGERAQALGKQRAPFESGRNWLGKHRSVSGLFSRAFAWPQRPRGRCSWSPARGDHLVQRRRQHIDDHLAPLADLHIARLHLVSFAPVCGRARRTRGRCTAARMQGVARYVHRIGAVPQLGEPSQPSAPLTATTSGLPRSICSHEIPADDHPLRVTGLR